MHEIDLSKYKVRTDLITDVLEGMEKDRYKKNEIEEENIHITEVDLVKDSDTLFKKKGKYITIQFEDVTDHTNREHLASVVGKELSKLLSSLSIKETDKAFVVGLGNRDSTPDALGPKVIDEIFVTKYLFDLSLGEVEQGIRNVSAFVPGVMGTTGIESSDIVLGIVERTKPDFLIVIDALASSSIDRVNKTIQMTDTGIHPGSGIGNSRLEISKDTIGIPVVAIGVPTVVDAVTIVSDTVRYLLKQISYQKENMKRPSSKLMNPMSQNYLEQEENLSEEEKEKILGMVGTLDEEEKKRLIFEVLTPIGYNLMVTPKEVDFVVEQLGHVLAKAINTALHEKNLSL